MDGVQCAVNVCSMQCVCVCVCVCVCARARARVRALTGAQTLLDQSHPEWWRGELDGAQGVFPASYVSVIEETAARSVVRDLERVCVRARACVCVCVVRVLCV